jgi:hypothetical protein
MSISKEHGRIEERTIRKSSHIAWLLEAHEEWKDLRGCLKSIKKRQKQAF